MRLPARAGEPVQLLLMRAICRHGRSRTTAAAASVRSERIGWCLDMGISLSGGSIDEEQDLRNGLRETIPRILRARGQIGLVNPPAAREGAGMSGLSPAFYLIVQLKTEGGSDEEGNTPRVEDRGGDVRLMRERARDALERRRHDDRDVLPVPSGIHGKGREGRRRQPDRAVRAEARAVARIGGNASGTSTS